MIESIHKYFDIGTVLWMSFPAQETISALRRIAADPNFDAVELTHFEDPQKRAEARKILDTALVRPAFAAQPILMAEQLNPNAVDEAQRLAAETRLKQAADEAEYLGASAMSFMAGHWDAAHKQQQLDLLLKTTGALCEYLGEKGMSLELEPFDIDMDRCALIGPAPLAAEYAARVCEQHHNFGLLIDLSHFPTNHEDSQDVVPLLARYTTHVHIGNAVTVPGKPAYGDKHPRFAFPDSANGRAELTQFLQLMKHYGVFRPENKKVLSFEVKPFADEDPELVLAGSVRVLNQCWAAVVD